MDHRVIVVAKINKIVHTCNNELYKSFCKISTCTDISVNMYVLKGFHVRT